MTERVGIRALQQNASAVVRRVSEGHVVEITDHGRVVARLVPPAADALATLVATGQASNRRRALSDEAGPLPRRRNGPTLGEILADARADES